MNNMGIFTFGSADRYFLSRADGDFLAVISFSSIDVSKGPPFNVTVCSCSDEVLVFIENNFNHTLMEGSFSFFLKYEMSFDKNTFPRDKSTLFSTTEHFTIREFIEG